MEEMKDFADIVRDASSKLYGKLESWVNDLILLLPNMVLAIIVMVLFYFIAKLMRRLVKKIMGHITDQVALNNLFGTITYLVFIFLGLFVSLNILHLEQTVSSLLAGAGIIGLALGFAFQDISANFISGIMIAFRKPFHVGDMVETNGYLGVVEEINLRVTIIKTLQGLHVIIPNKDIVQTPMTNYTLTDDRRVDLEVGVSYGEDLERVEEITREAVKDIPGMAQEPGINFYYQEFGDSSINFLLVFWIARSTQATYLSAKSEAVKRIKKAYDANNITIPFPIRTLDFGIKGGEKLSEMKILHQKSGSEGSSE